MPDVRIDVYADTHGAPKQLGDTAAALAGVEKGAGAADGTMGGLWKQFAIGTLAVDALKKAYGLLKGVVEDSIENALGQEKAEAALKSAIEITGRTVEGNLKHYLDFAAAQMKATTYTDDEIEATQALLLQLTKLDQQGVDRATKGAMGLATVMGMDLHGATVMVTKAMEGNFGALGRVGIKVAENLTAEQKQASLLDQLEKLYQRSTKETDTFGGSLKQLKNSWGEALETTGMAIIKNETLQKTVKDLKAWVDKLASSPEFQRWLNDSVSFLIKAAEWTGKFAAALKKVYDLKFPNFSATAELNAKALKLQAEQAEHAGKVNAGLVVAATAMGKSFSGAAPMLKAFGFDFQGVIDIFTAAPKKIDEVGTHTTALTAAQIKAAKEAAEALKKLSDAAADIVAKYNPLLGAMMKLKAEEDTLTKARNAGAMSAGAYDKAMAANAKAMKDVGLEAGKSAKAQGEMVKAAQEIINRYNPMHAAMVKAIDDEKKLNAAFGGGKDPKAYAAGLKVVEQELKDADAAAKKAKMSTGSFGAEVASIIIKLKAMGVNTKSATAAQKALIAMLVMGRISLKQYDAALAAINAELANKKDTSTWVENVKSAVAAVCAAMNVYFTYIDGKNEQALQKKLAQLDTEYQAQLKLIEQSMMNEEEKEAAIAALDTKYNAMRHAAEIKAAEQRKKTAIAQAIINTAQGVALAWGQGGFLFGAIMAAIVAAAGAVQIALIRSQPIGAAKGAIFKQKALLMSQATGQEYEVAEGGEAEIVSSPRQLREAIMGTGAMGGRGNPVNLTFNIHAFDGADVESSVRRKVVPLLQRMMKNELFLVHPRAVRTY